MKDRVLLCTLITGLIFGAIGALLIGLAFGEPKIFLPVEYKNVRIRVEEENEGSFTIDTATSWIEHSDGTSYVTETSAITAGTIVYAPVDGTTWTAGSEYHLYIKWGTDMTDEIQINAVQIKVEDGI